MLHNSPEHGHHKVRLTAEILAGMAAAAGAVAAINVGVRHKRVQRQRGYEAPQATVPIQERIKIFGFEPDSDETTGLTNLAAYIHLASERNGETGVRADELRTKYRDHVQLVDWLNLLDDNNFIEPMTNHGKTEEITYGYLKTEDMDKAIDLSPALAQASSEEAMRLSESMFEYGDEPEDL